MEELSHAHKVGDRSNQGKEQDETRAVEGIGQDGRPRQEAVNKGARPTAAPCGKWSGWIRFEFDL
jgi:hypothetical protein